MFPINAFQTNYSASQRIFLQKRLFLFPTFLALSKRYLTKETLCVKIDIGLSGLCAAR